MLRVQQAIAVTPPGPIPPPFEHCPLHHGGRGGYSVTSCPVQLNQMSRRPLAISHVSVDSNRRKGGASYCEPSPAIESTDQAGSTTLCLCTYPIDGNDNDDIDDNAPIICTITNS